MKVTLKFCVLLAFTWLQSSAFASKPNILFIIADDLGYHDVGYHGADIKTPNIDQVSRLGPVPTVLNFILD